ncbi:MAG: hypothetical protein VKK04_25630 [Synechococcales bacterium]|nr:hypothetical protein [Synechococcales bacterium]
MMRAIGNLMMQAFAGCSLEKYEQERAKAAQLHEVNRLIELRLAQHGFVFANRHAMGNEICTNPIVQQVIQGDETLRLLIKANNTIGCS